VANREYGRTGRDAS